MLENIVTYILYGVYYIIYVYTNAVYIGTMSTPTMTTAITIALTSTTKNCCPLAAADKHARGIGKVAERYNVMLV